MNEVCQDFAHVFMRLYFGDGELPAAMRWELLPNPDYNLQRGQYSQWYQVTVNDVPVALACKKQAA